MLLFHLLVNKGRDLPDDIAAGDHPGAVIRWPGLSFDDAEEMEEAEQLQDEEQDGGHEPGEVARDTASQSDTETARARNRRVDIVIITK